MKTFDLEVISPKGKEFEGSDVIYLKIRTTRGDLGVLADHSDLVTALSTGEMIVQKEDKKEKKYFVSGGFLEITKEKVIVLAEDIFESSDEENVLLKRKEEIENAIKQKIKEEQGLLKSKKRIQESLLK